MGNDASALDRGNSFRLHPRYLKSTSSVTSDESEASDSISQSSYGQSSNSSVSRSTLRQAQERGNVSLGRSGALPPPPHGEDSVHRGQSTESLPRKPAGNAIPALPTRRTPVHSVRSLRNGSSEASLFNIEDLTGFGQKSGSRPALFYFDTDRDTLASRFSIVRRAPSFFQPKDELPQAQPQPRPLTRRPTTYSQPSGSGGQYTRSPRTSLQNPGHYGRHSKIIKEDAVILKRRPAPVKHTNQVKTKRENILLIKPRPPPPPQMLVNVPELPPLGYLEPTQSPVSGSSKTPDFLDQTPVQKSLPLEKESTGVQTLPMPEKRQVIQPVVVPVYVGEQGSQPAVSSLQPLPQLDYGEKQPSLYRFVQRDGSVSTRGASSMRYSGSAAVGILPDTQPARDVTPELRAAPSDVELRSRPEHESQASIQQRDEEDEKDEDVVDAETAGSQREPAASTVRSFLARSSTLGSVSHVVGEFQEGSIASQAQEQNLITGHVIVPEASPVGDADQAPSESGMEEVDSEQAILAEVVVAGEEGERAYHVKHMGRSDQAAAPALNENSSERESEAGSVARSNRSRRSAASRASSQASGAQRSFVDEQQQRSERESAVGSIRSASSRNSSQRSQTDEESEFDTDDASTIIDEEEALRNHQLSADFAL